MSSFRRLPIKYKLIFVVLLTSSIGITIAALAFLSYDQIKQKVTLMEEMQILSKVVAMRSTAALSFSDHRAALTNLGTLNIRKNIRIGCMYDQEGNIFAETGPSALHIHHSNVAKISTECPITTSIRSSAQKFNDDYLDIFQPIVHNQKTLGLLYIRIGLEEIYARTYQQLAVSILIFLCSLGFGFLITSRLQKQIYDPIIELGKVASEISEKHNYSIRANATNQDELGQTVDAFNTMLNEIEQDKERLFNIAYYDHLTHLPNRRMFSEQLETDLTNTAETQSEKLALFFLDLDRFKEVNDTLGHDIGDLLLIEFAKRINRVLSEKATAFRLAGDEFTIIQRSLGSEQEAIDTAESLLKELAPTLNAGGKKLTISASIGIAISDGNDTTTSLMKQADIALYQAKDAGRGRYQLYQPN